MSVGGRFNATICTEKQARASKYINPLMTKSAVNEYIRPFGVLVRLLAKWSREWVKDRVGVRTGTRECNTSLFSLVLQNMVSIFVFVGSVAS